MLEFTVTYINWAAIIIEDGCVLMICNDVDDCYYSIGGGVHLGETSEEAVVREVKEETGITYEVDRLAFVNECLFYGDGILAGKECHGIEFYYLMKPRNGREIRSGSSHSVTTENIAEYVYWLPVGELKNHKIFPEFFKDKLMEMTEGIEHFISDIREAVVPCRLQ